MQKVLVTGGTKGIGFEIVKKFIRTNARVFVLARDFNNFALKEEEVQRVKFDLKEPEKIPGLYKQIGPVDILINNAGQINFSSYDNYPTDKKEEIIKVNLEAPVQFITTFSAGMIQKGKGRIISLSSTAGERGHSDIWYGITKAGVINFTKSFSKILGPKGIQINCIAPSQTATEMLNIVSEERKKMVLDSTVTKRFAKPEEVASVAYWLAVEAPDYINGSCIDINDTVFLR